MKTVVFLTFYDKIKPKSSENYTLHNNEQDYVAKFRIKREKVEDFLLLFSRRYVIMVTYLIKKKG